jgi:hypothetical protein
MKLCGAPKRKTHQRCRAIAMANGRCRLHGGKSTGPRSRMAWKPGLTAAGLAWRVWLAQRHALGLRHPGGRPAGRWWKAATSDREIVSRALADIIEKLPKPPAKPIEEWSLPELLTDTTRHGLMRVHDIVSAPLSDDIKEKRLQGEMGLGSARLLGQLQTSALQAQAHDRGWDELLARLAQNQKKSRKPPDSGSEK